MAFCENAKRHLSKAAVLFVSTLFLTILISSNLRPATAAPSGNTYYVAPNGNDNHAGSINKPWRTIDFATSNPILKPGDTVYVRSGVYNEYIKTEVSGAPATPIIFRNYPGETPVITGSGSWRWHVLDQSHIHIQGFTFSNFGKGGIQLRTRYEDMTGIVISHNTFENQHQLNNDGAKTIHVTSAGSGFVLSDVLITSNDFYNVDTGNHPSIQVAGVSRRVRILDNEISHTSSIAIGIAGRPDIGQPENILVKGNRISDQGSIGQNSIGIYLDGAGRNILVEENVINNGLQGIKVSLEPTAAELTTQHVIVRRNVLYNHYQSNLKLGVGSFSENCSQAGKLVESVAVHNTLFSDRPNNTNNFLSCGTRLRWKNNILGHVASEGFHYKLTNETVDPSDWILDHNFFYSDNDGVVFRWEGRIYDTLSAFQTVSNQESNAKEGNPSFQNEANYIFQLLPTSTAIDRGGPLTTTRNSGRGTTIPVTEAWYFSDGLGLQMGDQIRIGNNTAVTVVDVNYENNLLVIDRVISWQNGDSVSYNYSGLGPDFGAFEYTPQLIVQGIPHDSKIELVWNVEEQALSDTVAWRIEYDGPAGNQTSPIANIPVTERSFLLTGLENYTPYDVTLTAISAGGTLFSDTVTVMPTDIFVYLPHISR